MPKDRQLSHDRHFLWLVGFIATSAGLVIAATRVL